MRLALVGVLLGIATASANPQIATQAEHRARGRIIFANDDDWQWAESGLVPRDAVLDVSNLRLRAKVDAQLRFAIVLNCCFGRNEISPADGSHDTYSVEALERVLDAGGDVVLLDDGNVLAPVVVELLARRYGTKKCLALPSTPIKWVDGRTRALTSNAAVEDLAKCIGATTVTIERDTGMPGRVMLVGAFERRFVRPQIAR
jgi:hypothetical protein